MRDLIEISQAFILYRFYASSNIYYYYYYCSCSESLVNTTGGTATAAFFHAPQGFQYITILKIVMFLFIFLVCSYLAVQGSFQSSIWLKIQAPLPSSLVCRSLAEFPISYSFFYTRYLSVSLYHYNQKYYSILFDWFFIDCDYDLNWKAIFSSKSHDYALLFQTPR